MKNLILKRCCLWVVSLVFLALIFLGNPAKADITLNPNVRADFTLSWIHPSTYIDDSPLPRVNILSTVIEVSLDGATWTALPNTIDETTDSLPNGTANLLTAALAEGVYSYRVLTVVVGNLISSPSNTAQVTVFIPKPSAAPSLLTVE